MYIQRDTLKQWERVAIAGRSGVHLVFLTSAALQEKALSSLCSVTVTVTEQEL
jgi:hypothetical protein